MGADTKGKVTLKPSINSIFGAGSIREAMATAKVEHYMAGIPLREGIDELLKPSPQETVPDTSDEERELGGRPRPRRGAGWWGIGPPVATSRKGLNRPFVDGGGICSQDVGRPSAGTFRRRRWYRTSDRRFGRATWNA